MTVVLALRCADGLVLAADSQITDSARGLGYPSQKLHPFSATGAWGGSGARAVLTEVEKAFDEKAPGILVGSADVSREVQEIVVPLLRHHYDSFIAEVPGRSRAGPRRRRTCWWPATPGTPRSSSTSIRTD